MVSTRDQVLTAGDYLSAYVQEWTFPKSFSNKDALLVGTGRCAATDSEEAELGDLAAKVPFVLG